MCSWTAYSLTYGPALSAIGARPSSDTIGQDAQIPGFYRKGVVPRGSNGRQKWKDLSVGGLAKVLDEEPPYNFASSSLEYRAKNICLHFLIQVHPQSTLAQSIYNIS